MTSRLVAVALDCRDPEALVAFWCAALGYRVRERWSDAAGTDYVEIGDGDGTVLLFQPVREDKAVKIRRAGESDRGGARREPRQLSCRVAPVH